MSLSLSWPRLLALVLGTSLFASTVGAEDAELRGFVDGVMQSHLSSDTTVGATISVVQGDQVLMAAGYGFADVANQVPVDPANTLFRVGSISKVLVWMSVLQQIERAGATLDEDVSKYLESVELDQRFPSPVTLRHLMTHTPGFEDRAYGLFTDSHTRVPSLVDYLQANVPQQQWLPGDMVAYSNYGAALAARVVENLSGVGFNTYVQDSLLTPLGMRSTFSQDFGEGSKDRLAQGYQVVNGQPVRGGIEYVVPVPAGALSASATDIAQLMKELLNPNTSIVMSSDAKALLLQQAESLHPAINGRTLGLYEMTHGDGERAVGHDGATMLFHSRMMLWPEQRLGLFVSTNTLTGRKVVDNLVDALVARYQLGKRGLNGVTNPDTPASPAQLNAVVGHYGVSRRAYSGPLKVFALLSQIQVSRTPDGDALLVQTGPETTRYLPHGDHLYIAEDGIKRMHFVAGVGGVDRLHSSTIPVLELLRLPWHERVDLTVAFLVALLLINLLVVLRLPYTAVLRRAGSEQRPSAGWGRASLVAWLVALAVLVVVFLYASAVPDQVQFFTGGYRVLAQLNWAWPVLAFGAVVQLLFALLSWVRGNWWLARRGFYSLAALANVAFAVWLYYWNFHPFSLPAS